MYNTSSLILPSQEYMLGSKENEKDYFDHNKQRFYHTLNFLHTKYSSEDTFTVLDIGTSPFTFLLKKYFPHASIYTLDYGDTFKHRCKLSGIHFVKHDLMTKKERIFGIHFDIITFLETIEHLPGNYKNVLEKLMRHTKRGGYIIIQTSNAGSLKKIALKIISEKMWNKGSKGIQADGEFIHYKEFRKRELEDLVLSVSGIQMVFSGYQLYFDTVPSTMVYRKHPGLFIPGLFLYYFLVKIIPSLRTGLEVIIKKK